MAAPEHCWPRWGEELQGNHNHTCKPPSSTTQAFYNYCYGVGFDFSPNWYAYLAEQVNSPLFGVVASRAKISVGTGSTAGSQRDVIA